MKYLPALLCLLPGLALAQPVNVNPQGGDVWTYYGPTLGSGWSPPEATLANPNLHTYAATIYGNCGWLTGGDVGSCINTAITTASTGGGGLVVLPCGSFNLATTISLVSKVKLLGCGSGSSAVNATLLTWSGGASPMITAGTSASTAPTIDTGIYNIGLNGGGLATSAFSAYGLRNSTLDHVQISNVVTRGVFLDANDLGAGGVIGNRFVEVNIGLCGAAAINANGWEIGPGTPTQNTNRNNWYGGITNNAHGIGFKWGGSDGNNVWGGHFQPCSSADASTGPGMQFDGQYDASGEKSRGNSLFGSMIGGGNVGGIVSKTGGAGLSSAIDNVQYARKTEDGEPTPTCEAQGTAADQSTFRWQNLDGNMAGCDGGEGSGKWRLNKGNLVQRIVPLTADLTIAANGDRSWYRYVNTGASGAIVVTLPPATATGNIYCLGRTAAQLVTFRTSQSATDNIRLNDAVATASAITGAISANTSGSNICLVDSFTGSWRVYEANGIWTTELGQSVQWGSAMGLKAFSTAAKSYTSDTAFATVTGLTIGPLVAGKTYSCRGHLRVTASGAAGGVKVQIASDGTLSATSAAWYGTNYNGTTINANNSGTGLTATIAEATAVATLVDLRGVIVVNAGGNLLVQAAQNASSGTTTTIGVNSAFGCDRIN